MWAFAMIDEWAVVELATQAGAALVLTAYLVWRCIRILQLIRRSQRRIEKRLKIPPPDNEID